MKRAAVPLAMLAVLFFGSGARADTCEVKLADGSAAVWQGPCREGTPYGKGEVTHNGKTYKAVIEDVDGDRMRFILEDDGRPAARRVDGQRRNRAEPPGQAKGRKSQDGFRSFEGSASAGGRNRGESAGEAEGGAPAASGDAAGRDARGKYKFRNYTATGGGADGPDPGKPAGDGETGDWDAGGRDAGDGDAGAPPASTAARTPAPPDEAVTGAPASTAPRAPAPDRAAPDSAVERAPAHTQPAAVPCKLEVEGTLYNWSGPCDGGKAYGAGSGTAPDGTTYEGPAANGKAHGFGTVNAPDGGYYQGGFRNGLRHGAATIRVADGSTYNTRYDNGVEVGKRTPVEYAAPGDSEQDHEDGGASNAPEAETDPWSDISSNTPDDPWGPDTATAGSGADSNGAYGSDEDVPSYVAVLGKLVGVLVPGAAAEDEYVAAIGTLERREAARRAAERREAAEREAAAGGRNVDERPQRRAAPRDAPERRRAAAPNRNWEADRARRALRDRQRRAAERRRKSQALLQRNLKIARLQRQLNRELSSCGSEAAELLRIALDSCTNDTCVANCRRQVSNQRAQCRNRARRGTAIHLSRCKARARSAYRRQVGHLMTQRY